MTNDLPNVSSRVPARAAPTDLKSFLDANVDKIASVMLKGLSADRMVRLVCLSASRRPELAECTPMSVLMCMVQCAHLGLEPETPQRHAYLVPFRNNKTNRREAQLIIGYQGLCELAMRHERVKGVRASVVYEGDACEISLEPPSVKHEWRWGTDRSAGKILGAYAIAELTTGVSAVEVMTLAEIEAIRARSKAKDAGPWKTDYEAMCRKTVVRRLLQRGSVPMSSEIGMAETDAPDAEEVKQAQATVSDAVADMGVPPFEEDLPPKQVETGKDPREELRQTMDMANVTEAVVLEQASKLGGAKIGKIDQMPDALAKRMVDVILGTAT